MGINELGINELKFLGNPTLETERLTLRTLRESDAADVFAYASHPEVSRYVTWESHQTIEDSRAFISWVSDRVAEDASGDWGVELKETGRIVGSIGFVHVDELNLCGDVGYALALEYRGRGLMAEALRRIIAFAFTEMKLNRLEAVHFIENEASGRVMQKAGMLYEGLLRQRMLVKGVYRDVKQYAIVRGDWQSSSPRR
jgi:ribosomal-protein-alanine N-acetyltransferase